MKRYWIWYLAGLPVIAGAAYLLWPWIWSFNEERLGRAAFEERRYSDAVTSFQRALVTRPHAAGMRRRLGEAFADSMCPARNRPTICGSPNRRQTSLMRY